jgi:hypothetical protein
MIIIKLALLSSSNQLGIDNLLDVACVSTRPNIDKLYMETDCTYICKRQPFKKWQRLKHGRRVKYMQVNIGLEILCADRSSKGENTLIIHFCEK